jgi:TRAP-type C4-dicarboxylate transport system permease small subunit
MKLLRAVSRLSDLGLIASMVALVAIMLLVTVDVILRNLISNSISGAVEISEFLQGVLVFLGMAATLKSGHHIAADMLVQTFSIRNQAIVDLLTGLLSFAVMALMALALWAIATGPGASYEVTSVLEIPTQPFWMIASFGIALMCVELLRVVIACIVVLVGEPT